MTDKDKPTPLFVPVMIATGVSMAATRTRILSRCKTALLEPKWRRRSHWSYGTCHPNQTKTAANQKLPPLPPPPHTISPTPCPSLPGWRRRGTGGTFKRDMPPEPKKQLPTKSPGRPAPAGTRQARPHARSPTDRPGAAWEGSGKSPSRVFQLRFFVSGGASP